MKLLIVMSIVFAISSCSSNEVITMSYSVVFKLRLPASYFSEGTIFYSDELALKTSSDKLISGMVISNETEGLPAEFDIRDYPPYILGIKEAGFSPSVNESFEKSSRQLDSLYGLSNLTVEGIEGNTFYTLCKGDSCLAYIVKNSFVEHIFTVSAIGYEYESFNRLLNVAVNVK